MADVKRKTPRSRAYLAWLRQQPCVGCKRAPAGVAAHVRIGGGGGTGLKPSDFRAVPMCHDCHTWQHATGERTFWEELRRDPYFVVLRHIARYARERSADRQLVAAAEDALVEAGL